MEEYLALIDKYLEDSPAQLAKRYEEQKKISGGSAGLRAHLPENFSVPHIS